MPVAKGDLPVFTDDNVIPTADWLLALAAAARRWPDDAIFGGRIEPRFPADTPDWFRSREFAFGKTTFARYARQAKEGVASPHLYRPNFTLRRAVIGTRRFSEHLGPDRLSYPRGGDASFLHQFASAGYRFVYVPTAVVEHVVREEQIHDDWLITRALNKGRGQVDLPSQKDDAGCPYRTYRFG